MKNLKNWYLVSLIVLVSFTVNAQKAVMKVGTNPTTIQPSAILEIESTTKGFLFPRMNSFDRNAIVTPVAGLMVYDTDLNVYSYYDGTQWVIASKAWSLTGNTATNPTTNFIGTIDNSDLIFRRNNNRAGRLGLVNTSFGENALNPLSSAIDNTAIGVSALSANTTGYSNTALGSFAIFQNTDGFHNTAIGSYTMAFNNTGNRNTAIGSETLFNNITGSYNTATGFRALYINNSGILNVANGYNALYNNYTGSYNVALGALALYDSWAASYNTAVGYNALYTCLNGEKNTGIGSNSLSNVNSGSLNVALGYGTLSTITSGSNNTAIGYNTGLGIISGKSNTIIGANIAGLGFGLSNNIIIADGDGNQRINVDATGKVGIGTTTPVYNLDVVGDINASASVRAAGVVLTSDVRLKRNIKNIGNALKTVGSLRPVSYEKKSTMDATEFTIKENGFIAQELKKVLPDLVKEGVDKDKILSVNYVAIIPILTKAIQEQQAVINDFKFQLSSQQAQIEVLKFKANIVDDLQKQIGELKDLIKSKK